VSDTLAERFAALITDLSRMQYDSADPMRYSKRRAKDAAFRILDDAVNTARQVAELPGLIDSDRKEDLEDF
jgi:hypothetical protein